VQLAIILGELDGFEMIIGFTAFETSKNLLLLSLAIRGTILIIEVPIISSAQ
jgi:hypothetical protein